MSRQESKHRHKMAGGAAPGTLRIDPGAAFPKLTLMAYGADGFDEREVESVEAFEIAQKELAGRDIIWLNVEGLGDEETLRKLGTAFQLHRLVLEDVVNVGQRAKVEIYGDRIFLVARMPNGQSEEIEQLSLVFGKGCLITFQERAGDCFDGVRERIRHGRGIIRKEGADYLAYALVDALIDAYFPLLEQLGDELESLEDEVLAHPDRETVAEIHKVRRRLLLLRKAIWPHREMIAAFSRDAENFLGHETSVHLRDCYDHAIRIIDLLEAYREMAADLMATYLSSLSNRMNEVMKVLTIIATIFIPLSFIAGVYGMNFDPDVSRFNMPELRWVFGYPFALSIMGICGLGLLAYFWKNGWLKK